MIARSDFHTHTNFCDGSASAREMVESAVEKGLVAIGLSSHSPMTCVSDWSMKKEALSKYISEIDELKREFSDKIEIFAGFEADILSVELPACDYVIGSVHHIKGKHGIYDVDHTAKKQTDAAEAEFGGDMYAYCEAYYADTIRIPELTHADIIGHFDLVSKFNEGNALFDETDPRYRTAALDALRTLVKYGKPFEINTGAISRKYRTLPYPSDFILRELKALGGKIIINSDAHKPENICYFFDDAVKYALSCGFTSALRLTKNGFIEYSLK